MANDLEQLVLTISADTRQIQRALKKLEGDTNASTRKVERRFDALGKRVSGVFSGVGRGFAASFAGVAAIRGAQQLIDSATRIENALKVTGLAGEELTRVYDRLFASAQRNFAPLETLATLYSRIGLAQKSLGVSTEEMLGFTDKIALALRVQGSTADEARGALIQLTQALGSGIVRAEEYNSIIEGAPTIMRAAAAGLKEAGGDVAKLRTLVTDGKVSSEAFFRAFEAGSVILEGMVAGASVTVNQAFVKLQNTLVDAAGKFNDATGAGKATVEMLGQLAGAVNGLSNVFAAAAEGPIGTFIGKISQLNDLIQQTLPAFNALGLLDEGFLNDLSVAITPNIDAAKSDLRGQLEGLYSDLEAVGEVGKGTIRQQIADLERELYGGGPSTRGGKRGVNREVKPVSLSDYAVPAKEKKPNKERKSEWQRETEQIKERTAALQAETTAMAALNPLLNDYGFTLEKARASQELLNAAKAAGLEITPDLTATIEDLAGKYAMASVEAEMLAESQDNVRERAEEFADLGRDVMGGFIDDLVNGASAADAFAGALSKIGDKLLDIALNSINFGSLFGGGSSFGTKSGFASMIGIPGYAKGTSNHPGGLAIVGEKGPELLNLPKGSQVIPQMPQIASPGSSGGVVVNFSPVIDNRGASAEAVTRNEQQLAKMKAELPAMVVTAVRQANQRNVKF